ncbi:MAG: protein translocase subunit SecF [Bacteroidota bacterium]|nr:protein translocase subunit SecF [Candidatus Kapabacteria bacterium]MCX7937434.1 protein translocase subunit SecF [Chlorobiota bacterium]MDW8075794.1 protein translocase subunit SecF [Bacteroidota bacterium]
MEFFGKTSIDFLGKRRIFLVVSLVINIIGLVLLLFGGLRLGIDFLGGTEVAVRFTNAQNTDAVRSAVAKAGFPNAEIKSYGKANEFLIRVPDLGGQGEQAASARIVAGLRTAFPQQAVTVLKEDRIGPKIGGELRTKAVIAVLLAIVGILLYVAFRFEFIYGLGAVVALIHDVFVALTFVLIGQKLEILNLEFNQGVLAALLTVVGFSINDTVIIFDRIRENREKHKGMALVPMMNLSINETLSRTINTVLTVVLVLATLLAFGGEVLHGFSFTMLVGIITGTYSSIYIASAFVVWYTERIKKEPVETAPTRQSRILRALKEA